MDDPRQSSHAFQRDRIAAFLAQPESANRDAKKRFIDVREHNAVAVDLFDDKFASGFGYPTVYGASKTLGGDSVGMKPVVN